MKHNSLKSDRFFNTIFIPYFSGSMFFWVQVFQGPGFQGSGFSESRFVGVQGLGPGFRSSPHRSIYQQASLNKAIDKKIKSRFSTKLDGVWFSPDYQQ